MKKIAFLAIILFGGTKLTAQNLDFYPGLIFQDAWHPLTGDSVIMYQGFDDQIVGPIAIPNFTMGGVAYNQVYISSNGFITLGQAPSASEYSPITNGISSPIIAPFAANLAGSASANSSVSFKLGTSIQSNFEVQWTNVHRVGSPNEVFTFKMNIDFGGYWNFINFSYGDFQNVAATPSAVQVGLRVGSGNAPNLFSSREINPVDGWFPDVMATSSSSTMLFPASNTSNPVPLSGLKYQWYQSGAVNTPNPNALCDTTGNLVIYSNYDGGVLNINCDVDIQDLKIGVCTYEPVQVNISGPYASNVTQVIYSGFNSNQGHLHCGSLTPSTTTINGVSASIAQVLTMPAIGYYPTHVFGQAYQSGIMVGASGQCDTLYPHGGGNTADEIVGHFLDTLGGVLRFHHTQYGCWLNEVHYLSEGGTCCIGAPTTPVVPDGGAPINPNGSQNNDVANLSTVTRSITSTPNPASDYVDVQMSDKGVKVVRFTNVLGRLEWTTTTSEQFVSIPVSNLPSGLYLVEVQSDEGRARQYVVKR
jgi:hypothetical protein